MQLTSHALLINRKATVKYAAYKTLKCQIISSNYESLNINWKNDREIIQTRICIKRLSQNTNYCSELVTRYVTTEGYL